MNQFCNQLNVALVSEVQKIESGKIILKNANTTKTIYTDDFFIDITSADTSASTLHSVSKKITADKLSAEVRKIFSSLRSVIIECIDDRGDSIIVGSVEFPARMKVTPGLNQDIIHLDWKTPHQISM